MGLPNFRWGVFGVLGTATAMLLGACGLVHRDAEVRYKLTVDVVENGRVRSGSSVWSWRLSKPGVALASPYDGAFRGEAVSVDLGKGRTLFAILRGADGNEGMAQLLPERLFGDIGRSARSEKTRHNGDRIADLRDIASRTGETKQLDCAENPDWCPMFVTFGDIDEPKSIQQVDPKNLAAAFGPGPLLKSITVEVTDEEPEERILNRLAWLSKHPEPRLDRDYRGSANPNISQLLSHGDFRRFDS